jgi:hypothetical protein
MGPYVRHGIMTPLILSAYPETKSNSLRRRRNRYIMIYYSRMRACSEASLRSIRQRAAEDVY